MLQYDVQQETYISICGSMFECKNVKQLLNAIDKQFKTLDKTLTNTFMTNLLTMNFTNVKGLSKHIMQMMDITIVRLRCLNLFLCTLY